MPRLSLCTGQCYPHKTILTAFQARLSRKCERCQRQHTRRSAQPILTRVSQHDAIQLPPPPNTAPSTGRYSNASQHDHQSSRSPSTRSIQAMRLRNVYTALQYMETRSYAGPHSSWRQRYRRDGVQMHQQPQQILHQRCWLCFLLPTCT